MEYYTKMMREMIREGMNLKDHQPLPPQHQKHLERAEKVWKGLEGAGPDEQIRLIGACVYEALHWLSPHQRESFINNLATAIGAATNGVQQEEVRKGPSLIIPPGAKLS